MHFRCFHSVIPSRKRLTISIRPDKQSKATVTPSAASSSSSAASSSTKTTARQDLIHNEEDKLCVISEVEGCKQSESLNSIEVKQSPTPPADPPVKVPIFVLHPSGTHYVPMSIDASIVSHAFSKTSSFSRSTSSSSLTNEPIQCHPVSIPVNFNPISSLSDPYELDIQNINVIGTRHQTSVRPNWLASNIVLLFLEHRFSTHLQVYTWICHPCAIDPCPLCRSKRKTKNAISLEPIGRENNAASLLYGLQIRATWSIAVNLFSSMIYCSAKFLESKRDFECRVARKK